MMVDGGTLHENLMMREREKSDPLGELQLTP
jgi:hypothetical protein